MKKSILLLPLHDILFNQPVIAQENGPSKKQLNAVIAYLSLGYLQKDFKEINQYSTDNDMPVFSTFGVDLGFGGMYFLKGI